MSYTLFKEDIVFLQRFLAMNGYYQQKIDGVYGYHTDKALKAFDRYYKKLALDEGSFDVRSEQNIYMLCPAAQVDARHFLQKAQAAKIDVRIISGTRTYKEQNLLYQKGRMTRGPIVTYARPGYSMHNFGLAWDVAIFKNGAYVKETFVYKELAELRHSLPWNGVVIGKRLRICRILK